MPEDPEFLVPFGKANVMRTGQRCDHRRLCPDEHPGPAGRRRAGKGRDLLRGDRPAHPESAGHGDGDRLGTQDRPGRVVEECWRTAGLGGDIAHRIHEACFESLLAPVKRVAGLDVPMPYSRKIEQLCIPQVETIVAAVKEIMA